MPLPLFDYVKQVMLERGRGGLLHGAIARAWSSCCTKYPERLSFRRKSTFRNLVWEAAIREISAISGSDPDINVVSHRDTVSFIIEDSILVRFKHADLELATANYPTPEALEFDNHEVDLYGFGGLQRVELVYVLNEYETEIVWTGITARRNGEFLWKLELTSEGVAAELPGLPLEQPDDDTARLARLKETDADTEAERKKKRGGK